MQATGNDGLRARIGELARYGAVGGGLVVIEYAIYVAIVGIWPDAALPAYLLSRLIASVAGFIGHSRFSFGHGGFSTRSGVRYALSVAANMALAALLLMATLPLFGALVAKLVSDCIVIPAGYLTGRAFVFAPTRVEAAR